MLNRPGVEVQFASVTAVPRDIASPSTYFSVGYATWGPINTPVFCADERDVTRAFGAPKDGMWLVRDAQHYYETAQGSGRGYHVRAFELGMDGATPKTAADYTAKVALQNASSTDVLTVSAAYPGSLGNNFKTDVVVDNVGLKRIYLWGRGAPVVITWGSREVVEAQIKAVNDGVASFTSDFQLALAGTWDANGPATTTTGTVLFGASATAKALIGGSDGATASYDVTYAIGGVDATTGAPTGLEALNDTAFGPGTVAIPGYVTSAALVNALELHGRLNQRLAVTTLVKNGDPAITAQQAKALVTDQTLPQSSYVAYYFPKVYDNAGVLSPLDGFVAGLASRNQSRIDREGGIKASVTGSLPITGVRQIGGRDPIRENGAEGDLLYGSLINYVRYVRGTGYRLESQLLSKAEGAISRLHHRYITLKMWYDLTELLEGFRDRTIDGGGVLQDEIKQAIETYLDPYGPGKFAPKGNTLWDTAAVVTDNSIQSESDINQGLLKVLVEAAFSPKAERISLLFNVNAVSLG